MTSLEWLDDSSFRLGEVTFGTTIYERFSSSREHFMLVKPPHMVERYEGLVGSLRPQRIVELGICQGGSTAFLSLLARPERLVALDIKTDPTGGLEEFIDERALRHQVHTHYSFDQADAVRLRELIAEEFAGERIDLVVDDASHLVGPTRTSFNALFPQLRPGGVYVIEDWSGPHKFELNLLERSEKDPSVRAKLEEGFAAGKKGHTPLSVLLFEAHVGLCLRSRGVCRGRHHRRMGPCRTGPGRGSGTGVRPVQGVQLPSGRSDRSNRLIRSAAGAGWLRGGRGPPPGPPGGCSRRGWRT